MVQWGGLVTWQTDVSGDDAVNTAVAQPLLFLQMGKGTYLRSSGAWVFDLENDSYYVPVGFGIGKVIKSGRSVFNIGSSLSSRSCTTARAIRRSRSLRGSICSCCRSRSVSTRSGLSALICVIYGQVLLEK